MKALRTLLSTYFQIDYRTLALFRIAFGATCLIDILRRIPLIDVFYSNDGVMTNHYSLFVQEGWTPFSLLFAFSSTTEVTLFFVLGAVAAFLFTIGYKTKWSQIATLIFLVSIHNRTLIIQYGGDVVMNIFLLWTLPLPLGERFSVDAHLKDSPPKNIGIQSFIVLALQLQLAAIYGLNALQKNGNTWQEGSAVYYLTHQNCIATSVGIYARENLPFFVFEWLSYGALFLEFAIPILILSPLLRKWTSLTAILFIFLLHSGIALFSELAVFPLVMMSVSLLLIPNEFWHVSSQETLSKDGFSKINHLREIYGLLFFCLCLSEVNAANPVLRNFTEMRNPRTVSRLVHHFGITQGWLQFAPDAPRTERKLIFDVELQDGSHLDPITGKVPDFEANKNWENPFGKGWCSYSLRIGLPQFDRFRIELDRWIRERSGRNRLPIDKDIRSITVYEMTYRTPKPGRAGTTIPVGKRVILKHDLKND